VPDGTAICEHCDHILDKSFLGEGFTDEAGEDGGDELDQDDGDDLDEDGEEEVEEDVEGRSSNKDEVEREMEELRSRRRVEKNPPRAAAGIEESKDVSQEAGKLIKDVQGTFSNAWGFYKALGLADKLCTAGGAADFLFAFFPWVTISGASSVTKIGIEVGGLLSMLMGAAMIALVYIRQKRHWRDKQKIIIYAQIGVACITLIYLLYQMGHLGSMAPADTDSPIDMTIGTHTQIGLVFSVLGAMAMAAGAGLLLKEKVLDHKRKR